MKLISSSYHRRVPLAGAAVGLVGAVLGIVLPGVLGRGTIPLAAFLPFILVMGLVAFVLWKLFSGLADQVWDDGDALVVEIGGEMLRVPLADIVNVNYSSMTNPPRATLRLRNATPAGREIVFIPKRPFSINPFARNPIMEDLIDRIDARRRRL